MLPEALQTGIGSEPFPGLRAFEPYESFLFFGRHRHTAQLLDRFAQNRFLAVVGASGSGKSSLVRAGLLPHLSRGYLAGATSRWRIAIMRPGNAPFDRLAEALAGPEALGQDAQQWREMLGRTTFGICDIADSAQLADGESLLIVVDQFEELLRYQREASPDVRAQDDLFVQSLLEATHHRGTQQRKAPVYVVLTMRSEFLGDCSQFPGLPEALNQSQYLIPPLDRDERREAIEGPLRLAGVGIDPWLVERILNDAGEDPLQLPILQHALARTYRYWKDHSRQAGGEAVPIGFEHYRAQEVGGLLGALHQHADDLYLNHLAAEDQPWAERLFRCLTTVEKGREVRRPTPLHRVFEITSAATDADRDAIRRVIGLYAARDTSFVVYSGESLTPESVVDISHESLIWKWRRLNSERHVAGEWITKELESANWYRDLARSVERYQKHEGGLWRDPDLARAIYRRDHDRWNPAWAAQYAGSTAAVSFEDIQSFLEQSHREQLAEQEAKEAARQREIAQARALAASQEREKRWYRLVSIAGMVIFILSTATAYSYYRAATQQRAAVEQRERAEAATAVQETLQVQLEELQLQREEEARARDAYEQAQQSSASQGEIDALRQQLSQATAQLSAAEMRVKSSQDNVKVASSNANDALIKENAELRQQIKDVSLERDRAVQASRANTVENRYALPAQRYEVEQNAPAAGR